MAIIGNMFDKLVNSFGSTSLDRSGISDRRAYNEKDFKGSDPLPGDVMVNSFTGEMMVYDGIYWVKSTGGFGSSVTTTTTGATIGSGSISAKPAGYADVDVLSGAFEDINAPAHTEKSILPDQVMRIVARMKKEETFGDLEFNLEFQRDYIRNGLMLVLKTNEEDYILFHTTVEVGEQSTDEMWRKMEDLVLENGLVNPIRMVTGIEAAGL